MKKILIPIIGLVALFTVMAFADVSSADTPTAQGTCGTNLTWEWYDSSNTLIIGGNGTTMNNFGTTSMPWYTYITQITTVMFDTPNLTNIGEYAFYGATSVTEYQFPSKLTTFGRECFENNTSLPSHFVIPNSVNSIGRTSFAGCSQITKLTMPVYCEVSGFGSGFSHISELILKPSDTTTGYSTNDTHRIWYESRAYLKRITLDGVVQLPNNTFEGCILPNVNARFYLDENKTNELSMNELYSTTNRVIYVGYENIIAQGIDTSRVLSYYLDNEGAMTVSMTGNHTNVSSILWTYSKEHIKTIHIQSDVATRLDTGNLFRNLTNCSEIVFDTPQLTTTDGLYVVDNPKLTKLVLPIKMSTIGSGQIANLPLLSELDINLASLSAGSLANCPNLYTLIVNQDNNKYASTSANITKIIIKKGTGNIQTIQNPVYSLYSGLESIQFEDDVEIINAGLFTNTGVDKVIWPKGWLGNYTSPEFTVPSTNWSSKLYMAVIKSATVDLNIENETLNFDNVNSVMDVSGQDYILAHEFMVYPTDYETGTDTGVAGLLMSMIPVFVLLAILGSIAYMFVNRNETN